MSKVLKRIGCIALILILAAQPVMAEPADTEQNPAPAAAAVTAAAIDTSGTETEYQVRLTGFGPEAGEIVRAAVWSESGGQDDLVWYTMNMTGADLTADIPVSAHRTSGRYFVHIYTGVNGYEKFVTNTEFSVSEPSASGVSVSNINKAGSCDVDIAGVSAASGVRLVSADVWSAADKSDLYTYTAQTADGTAYSAHIDIKNHNYNIGTYNIEAKIVGNNGVEASAGTTTVTFSAVEAEVTETLKDGKHLINVAGISVPAGLSEVKYYVWSEKDGQDDLKVYTSAYNGDGTASVSFLNSDFNTFGKYLVHVYGTTNAGKSVFLGLTSYDAAAPSAQKVEAVNDNASGDFEIKITGFTSGVPVSEVKIPVWSTSNQSDLYWYKASKDSDGNYVVKGNISNHKFNIGKYYADVYAYTAGASAYVGGTTMDFKLEGDPVVTTGTVNAAGGSTRWVMARNINVPGELKEVRFAVWSTAGGQDDLKWYTAPYRASSRDSYLTFNPGDFSTYGAYQVHVYGKTAAGKSVYIGKTEYTVTAPSAQKVEASNNNAAGTFKITVKGVVSDAAVSQVRAAVWCKKDQSDLKWYVLSKDSNGDYTANGNISNHQYSLGDYKTHVYVKDINNYSGYVGQDSMTFAIKHNGVIVGEGVNERWYPVTVKDLEVPGGCRKVTFAVWSVKNGQDDLVWYSGSKSGSDYTAAVDISKHKTEGQYLVHVYAQQANGTLVYVGQTGDLNVNPTFTATVAAGNPNNKAGTFEVYVKIESKSSNITKLSLPVWCASNQSDIKWYDAVKLSDGTYKITVDVANHKNNLGTYRIHAYATFENGIRKGISGTTYTFNPPNFLGVMTGQPSTRTFTLKNPPEGTTSVRFAVWSATGGQDDLKWLDAVQKSDGSWEATTKTAIFKHAGNSYVHCFVNGGYLTQRQFTVQPNEIAKNGWFYEGGYKFYYVGGVRQKDVRGRIPVNRGYRAELNRRTCTVTIYTYDWETADSVGIVPVCAFACSVGMWNTPTPVGTFYTLAKFRWKELMGPTYGQYCTRVTNDGIYFHSVAGVNMTSYNLIASEYNKLGSPASHGCIRLCVRDAKWIYDNCSLSMRVDIFDSWTGDPMGKPATIKIPAGQTWDPTDPNL